MRGERGKREKVKKNETLRLTRKLQLLPKRTNEVLVVEHEVEDLLRGGGEPDQQRNQTKGQPDLDASRLISSGFASFKNAPNIQTLLRESLRLRLGRLMTRSILLHSIQLPTSPRSLVPRHSRHSTRCRVGVRIRTGRSVFAPAPVVPTVSGPIVRHRRAVGGDGESSGSRSVSTWGEGRGGQIVGLGSDEGRVGFGSLGSPESEEEVEGCVSVGKSGEGVLMSRRGEEEGRRVSSGRRRVRGCREGKN